MSLIWFSFFSCSFLLPCCMSMFFCSIFCFEVKRNNSWRKIRTVFKCKWYRFLLGNHTFLLCYSPSWMPVQSSPVYSGPVVFRASETILNFCHQTLPRTENTECWVNIHKFNRQTKHWWWGMMQTGRAKPSVWLRSYETRFVLLLFCL